MGVTRHLGPVVVYLSILVGGAGSQQASGVQAILETTEKTFLLAEVLGGSFPSEPLRALSTQMRRRGRVVFVVSRWRGVLFNRMTLTSRIR